VTTLVRLMRAASQVRSMRPGPIENDKQGSCWGWRALQPANPVRNGHGANELGFLGL
jgi:hypothetical protein